jgi:N-acetyl-anhydromuramyl-L-alanine amidase AmpD
MSTTDPSTHVILPAAPKGDDPNVPFRQARFYRLGRFDKRGRPVSIFWIVLHTAECAETKNAAEALQNYCATLPADLPSNQQKSWHYSVDTDSSAQSVLEKDTSWHAPPLNPYSIGIEQAGRASQLASGWNDPYSVAMVNTQLIPLVTGICRRRRIIPRTLPDELLLEGLTQIQKSDNSTQALEMCRKLYSGIVTHSQISRVFKKSTHTDPGAAFPMDSIVLQVEQAIPPIELMAMGSLAHIGGG